MKEQRGVVEALLAERAARAGSPLASIYRHSSIGRNEPDEWLGHAPAILIPVAPLLAWGIIIASVTLALTSR